MKKFVIAGNYNQALEWIEKDIRRLIAESGVTKSISDYVVLDRTEKLAGFANPTGVFVGTWRERNDLDEIFMALLSHTLPKDQSHRTINKIYGDWMASQGRVVYK